MKRNIEKNLTTIIGKKIKEDNYKITKNKDKLIFICDSKKIYLEEFEDINFKNFLINKLFYNKPWWKPFKRKIIGFEILMKN